MNRKFLEDMGLEKEKIDLIMAENGKDLEPLKAVKSELAAANETIKAHEAQLEELKKVDAVGMNAKIAELQAANEKAKAEYEASLRDTKVRGSAEGKLRAIVSPGINLKAVMSLVDIEKAKAATDADAEIDAQLKAIQETEKWAFTPTTPPRTGLPQGGNKLPETATVQDEIKAQLFGSMPK